GALARRRGAVARHEVVLRMQRRDPFAINVDARAAEEVDRTEKGVALENVAIEVRQRLRYIALRHDRKPQPKLAEAHRLRLEIDAEEVALDDALPIAAAEA